MKMIRFLLRVVVCLHVMYFFGAADVAKHAKTADGELTTAGKVYQTMYEVKGIIENCCNCNMF